MAIYKYIYWGNNCIIKGKQYANIHLLVGYNQSTITDFQDMATELRKTFPFIKNSKIQCGQIEKSMYCRGFSIISYCGMLKKKKYKGWGDFKMGNIEYVVSF